MPSWVRYSVAVYVGLLLAGSLMASKQASAWPWGVEQRQVVRAESPHRSAAPAPIDEREKKDQRSPDESLDPSSQRALPHSLRERAG